jgi:hypothetical protein
MDDIKVCLNCGKNSTDCITAYCDKCSTAFKLRHEELMCELSKSLTKKKRAKEMLRCQKRRKIEWVILTIFMSLTGVFLITFVVLKELPVVATIAIVVGLLLVLVVFKTTRYTGFDLDLKTEPELACRIDYFNVPDLYISKLNKEIKELEEKLSLL